MTERRRHNAAARLRDLVQRELRKRDEQRQRKDDENGMGKPGTRK